MLEIRPAITDDDYQHVRRLVLAFVDWLRVLFTDDPALIDEYFEALKPELARLPADYGPPHGRLLLAVLDERPVGVVALRPLGGDPGPRACEMKRMYVDAAMHGRGVGRALALALLEEAQRLGYACMRLDTSRRQTAAIALYRSLGFLEVAPYYDASPLVRASMHFMEKPLQPTLASGAAAA